MTGQTIETTAPPGPASREPAPAAAPPLDRGARRDPVWLGLLAAAVCVLWSWRPSKWDDEAATQTAATRSLGELWRMVQNVDAVHGLYYAGMHFWAGAFGTSAFSMRLPSVIAIGAACAGVAVLGRRLGGRTTAVCAALVFMLLPRVTWIGIEARSQALATAVSVWLMVLLLEAVSRRRVGWWALYAATAAAGIVLNIYLALLLAAHGATLLWSQRRIGRRGPVLTGWSVAALAAVAASLPVVRAAVAQTDQLPTAHLRPPVGDLAQAVLMVHYFTGATPTDLRDIPLPPTSLWSLAVLLLAGAGWALMAVAVAVPRARPRTPPGTPATLLAVCLPWVVLPTALVIGYAMLRTNIYNPRYFFFTAPAAALLMGGAAAALRRRRQRVAALAVLAALALPVYATQRGPTGNWGWNWRQAAHIVQAHAEPGQSVYFGLVLRGSASPARAIAQAYPEAFAGLHDVTLEETGAQTGTLWGTWRTIGQSRPQLRRATTLWAVLEHRKNPSPAVTETQLRIERQGLALRRIWRGPVVDVLEFSRAPGRSAAQ